MSCRTILTRTKLTLPSRAVMRFYNERGTSEQSIKESKQAVKITLAELPGASNVEAQLAIALIGSQAYANARPRIEKGNPGF